MKKKKEAQQAREEEKSTFDFFDLSFLSDFTQLSSFCVFHVYSCITT